MSFLTILIFKAHAYNKLSKFFLFLIMYLGIFQYVIKINIFNN